MRAINQPFDANCPVCESVTQVYLFNLHGTTFTCCAGCGLFFSSPYDAPDDGASIQSSANKTQDELLLLSEKTETDASRKYMRLLVEYFSDAKEIFVVSEINRFLSAAALEVGLDIVGFASIGELEKGFILANPVDAVVIIYKLEESASLADALNQAYKILKPGGGILIATLSLDSVSARFFKQSWTGWQPKKKYYFNNTTIQMTLWKFGFRDVFLEKDVRAYTLAHINQRALSFPNTWVTRTIHAIYNLLPSIFHGRVLRLPSSGMVVMARKAERPAKPVLSVIVPVYNESATFPVLMRQLLELNLHGVEKEVIIVESNSKDNSRALVLEYEKFAGVKIVLQDKPLGKGNAVRAGFEIATGDAVLIQDADLEYDLNDYKNLIDPVVSYRKPFVLGARHGGNWKMRHFAEQKQLSAYLNLGHVFFATLLNWMYGQRLKDPFTMFKVFHRDCLYNLKFECNRFDFDFELVIKLIRKGYIPVEIPVNYNSRSFAEGKKVNIFRDPFTWLRALVKYRFVKITKE